MKKTFWSVTYAIYGAYHTSTMWFKTKEEAEAFAKGNHTDLPIRRIFNDPLKIAAIEHIIDHEGGERI